MPLAVFVERLRVSGEEVRDEFVEWDFMSLIMLLLTAGAQPFLVLLAEQGGRLRSLAQLLAVPWLGPGQGRSGRGGHIVSLKGFFL